MAVNNVACVIDLDGVVWYGGKVFDTSKAAFELIKQANIPYVFVTNGNYTNSVICDKINKSLDLSITSKQAIMATSPCINLKMYHDKRILLVCQDDDIEIAREVGFTNFITVAEICKIFPSLDYIDHHNRKTNVVNENKTLSKDFQPVEAIVILGEPTKWESALQIIIDILMTNGDPRYESLIAEATAASNGEQNQIPYPHLPLIACNKDLTFKGAALLPRFGNGAFLKCLEVLYKNITKHELKYEYIMGKPFMCTYEFAIRALESLYPLNTFEKLFILGDNPEVDIRGANLFRQHLKQTNQKLEIESILLCTGIYKLNDPIEDKPNLILDNLHSAIRHVLDDLKSRNALQHEA